MTVFDTLRWPVTRDALCNGTLLDELPTYLRNRWWCDIQGPLRSTNDKPYIFLHETSDEMRYWLQGLNSTRLEPMMYSLRIAISKWGE